jgi:poly(A) polymerase
MQEVLGNLPTVIFDALRRVAGRSGVRLFLVGGTVRDMLLGRMTHDIDISAAGPVLPLARLLREELGGGALVDLSGPDDEVTRVVWQGEQVDFSTFRAGVATIEEDLRLRDFSINALAVPLVGGKSTELLDPTGGMADLQAKRISHCPGAFAADPLRMLRGYRLAATLGFHLEPETTDEIRKNARLIARVAAERIGYEMRLIFASSRTGVTLAAMDRVGLLPLLLPELYRGAGLEQPEFHHLDVLGHSFLALQQMEEIIARPGRFFAEESGVTEYLEQDNSIVCLKWAALMHDIGKPATRDIREEANGRVTFYRHDEVGRDIFQEFAERCRWSKADTERTGGLIAMHMHPFHLCNSQREGRITRRAALKLCHRAGNDLPGLFVLAMADSLASRGEKKPERMEEELIILFDTVRKIYKEYIEPVLRGPRLISGKDLIETFGLAPGPLFAEILAELEVARIEGAVVDRQSALRWVEDYLQERSRT